MECDIRSQDFRDYCVYSIPHKLENVCKSALTQTDQFNSFHSFHKWLSQYCNFVDSKIEYTKTVIKKKDYSKCV